MQSKSTVVAPANEVTPVPPKENVAMPSVRVKAFTEVRVRANADMLTCVLAALPRDNVPVPFGVTLIFELLAEVVISITPAESISMPPALAVICNASAPVPVELNTSEESNAPATAIVKSCPAPVLVTVRFEAAPIASILIAPPAVVSIVKPPVPRLISRAVAPVTFPMVMVRSAAPVPTFIA